MAHLRRTRGMRRSRHHTQKTSIHGQITDAVSISERPPAVEDRALPGHWEVDLLFGSKNSQIVTLVERQSRYVMLAKVGKKDAETVVNALIKHAPKLPHELYQSLTWNRDGVTISFAATDDAGGSLVDAIHYTLSGAQTGTGSFGASGALTISSEGVTTVTYFAVDRAGNAETARTLRIAIDRTPPAITGMPGASCNLWPPNNKMVEVATVVAADGTSG